MTEEIDENNPQHPVSVLLMQSLTQEEKQLLLKDLCARLPYWIIVKMADGGIETLLNVNVYTFICNGLKGLPIPYLRQMSSMTEDELREFAELKFKNDDVWEIDEFIEMKFGFKGFINIRCRNKNNGDTWIYQVSTRTPLKTYWGVDWLNSHHFDYRGLIEKGLAIEAPEGMYKTE